VVGSSIFDLVAYAPRLPRLGETLPGTRFATGFGGKGANQAVMAAKLGAAVTMVTKLGDDTFGRDYLDNFRALGFDLSHVSVTDRASTGVAPIWVDESSGDNQIIVVLGANELLTPADVRAAEPALASSAVVVCQWECPLPVVTEAFRLARGAGVRTIFNPAPVRGELPDELYRLCDFFCPNESEAEALTGAAVATLDQAVAAARVLLARGVVNVVMTLGSRGSMLVNATTVEHVPVDPVAAVDTTGAGDAFVGSLSYFFAREVPVLDAMRRANCVAAISVQRPGTQSSFPSAADLPPELLG
jgi:ribokinase